METGTGLTILGTAMGSAKVLEKILGPTAEYIGTGVRTWTERRVQNVARVFRIAADRLGEKVETPGAVPPKVLKNVLQEAAFSEDELTAEYFGGVLASSRSQVARDDRGAAFATLVGRLTSYQIRAHYLFYLAVRRVLSGSGENLAVNTGRTRCRLFIPFDSYYAAMDFTATEDFGTILPHCMFGLSKEGLIEADFQFGSSESLRPYYQAAEESGILFAPSFLGVELFLWAHGHGNLHASAILDPDLDLSLGVPITITAGIRSTTMVERVFPKS
jgi:hypothetical protein